MSCGAPVKYTVPSGWGYKELDYKCGNTGLDGEAVLCAVCSKRVAAGEMARPGYCIHGVRITEYDCDCVRCETGE